VTKLQQFRDPEDLQAALAGKHPDRRRVVGIDLGTNCGVAWADIAPEESPCKAVMTAGQLDLSLGPYDSGPLRFIRLKQFLSVLAPDFVAFEDVKFTPDIKGFGGKRIAMIVARVATSSELLGGFKVVLTTWAEENGIPAEAFPIGKIKKHATGKGNANKVDMIKAANTKFDIKLGHLGYEQSGADNIADAMHICDMAIVAYRKGLK
jgi:Holliday junction resolvasome RuvABC endonuclease subunit